MAFVLSSVSGNLISAASAGYAPTNGGDVSAIASAYAASAESGKLDSSAQVVTSTATQLYAGTAYLTSVNGAPVSASRAGNAANASLANSAWYDGTGRFISALPDSATVSAIASAYTTGKQDTLAFSYDGDKISAINGSALAGQGGATGDYVEKSSMDVTIGSNITAGSTAFAQGSANSSIGRSFAQGDGNTAGFFSFAQGGVNNVSGSSFAQGSANFANGTAFAQGIGNTAVGISFAQGVRNSARYVSFAQGVRNSAINTATVFGMYNLHGDGSTSTGNSAAFAIGDGTAANARHDLMLVTKDGEITMFSSTADTVGTGIMSSIRTISAAAAGGVDSATVSAIASSYAESAASSKLDMSAFNSGDFYSTSNPSGFITGVDLTPYQPTSAMSAYATTAYVTSGLSGKENVFNAGTGLEFVQSGSDRVLQVEAPVDIVAGPGITIDNPDGNTLRVSVDQAIETVLYDANSSPNQTGPWTLSEVRTNFEWIDIVFGTDAYGNEVKVQRFKADSPYMKVDISRYDEDPNWKISTMTLTFSQTTMAIKSNSIARYMISTAGAISVSTAAAQAPFIYQVIGIHRTASN